MFGFGLSGHDIYEQVTGGPGTGSLDAARQAAELEADLEAQRAERIRRIAEKTRAGWQGAASDGAVGAAAPMADAMRDRGGHLRMATLLLDAQSRMFNHTKNSVVPVPAEAPKSNFLNNMVPWETDLDKEITRYQNNVQHNFAVYESYDSHSLSNGRQLPREYSSNTQWTGDVSVAQPGSPGERRPSGPEFVPPTGHPQGGGGPDPVDGPSSVSGPPRPVDGSQQPQDTDPSGATPPPEGAPPGTRPPVVDPRPPGSQPPPGHVPPVGGWPVGKVPPDARGTFPPGGRPPGFGPDGGRGSGPGVRGGAGTPEGGPGGRGAGAGGGPGGGGRPGAGVGGLAGEEGAARRGGPGAAGGRGAGGGAGGFAPMGAGRPAGDEDYEHQRKYLIEPDPEDMFGTDEVTAPPVIGEGEE